MPKSCVHALLPSKSIAFLALTGLPWPLGFSDSAARSGIHLTLAV